VKKKWSNVSTKPQAFVLCVGANVPSVRPVRRTAVQDYSQDTFLPLRSLCYKHFLYIEHCCTVGRSQISILARRLGTVTHAFCGFTQFCHKNVGTVSLLRPRPLPYTYSSIQCELIIRPFDALRLQVLSECQCC